MGTSNLVRGIVSAVVIIAGSCTSVASPTSNRIETSAKKSYVFMTYLKDDAIKITTKNDSVVTLTGTVSEWSHRALAEETVAGLPGVKRVENNLQAKDGQPAEGSDIWIGMKVKMMLLLHRNVSGIKTTVNVKDGVVTLTGEASSDAQKELTTEYVKDIDGVTSINNEMKIESKGKSVVAKVEETIDDVSITAQIKTALLFHKSTNVLKTAVTTEKGVVTVSGTAKNSSEKELVGKLVNDIKGVKGLKNEITIE